MGYLPSRKLPLVVLYNPGSFGNYDDKKNVLHICYWPTLPGKYLDDNYQKLPGTAAYTWYQATMIIEVSNEKSFETFKQAVERAGRPL